MEADAAVEFRLVYFLLLIMGLSDSTKANVETEGLALGGGAETVGVGAKVTGANVMAGGGGGKGGDCGVWDDSAGGGDGCGGAGAVEAAAATTALAFVERLFSAAGLR